MKKQNIRTLSLIVCTFTYLLVGAAIFDSLESENEVRTLHMLTNMSAMLLNKYNITDQDYRIIETVVTKSAPFGAGNQWKFAGAFYFAITVLTTIGYGHSTPRTVGGKVFTMCYALAGIPLGLVMFQSIGDRVNRASSIMIRHVKRSLKWRSQEASELDLIVAVGTLSVLVVAGGAAAFSREEGWTYFNSVYYCFITLTTIGFGDMVALQQDNALNRRPDYVVFALVFILFGLAVVAASLNLLVLRFVTMNTEDERRDEAEALQAAQETVWLEGDVITAHGASLVVSDQRLSVSDVTSVCSCRCNSCWPSLPLNSDRGAARHSSSRRAHLLSWGTLRTPSPTVEDMLTVYRPRSGSIGKRDSVQRLSV